MRIKFQNILFVLLLSVVSPCGIMLVQAQDGNFPGTEIDDLEIDKETERFIYTPGELDPAFRKIQKTTPKDTTALKPSRPTKIQLPEESKAPVKQPAQEDDSILSFNFLYYIFQKYKLQDIVD